MKAVAIPVIAVWKRTSAEAGGGGEGREEKHLLNYFSIITFFPLPVCDTVVGYKIVLMKFSP